VKAKIQAKVPAVYRYSTLLVIVIPALLYISALRLGFVYFDDDILVLSNYEKISHLSNLGRAFHSDAFFANLSPYYRPFQNVSLMFDAAFGGKAPLFYHLSNIGYHVLSCVSLLWLLGLLGFSKPKSLVATLIFAVHPVMGHAVLWIPARGDLLVTLFGILSCSFFIRFLKEGKMYYLALQVVCLAGAMFSKESAVLLPFLFLFYLVLTKQKLFNTGKLIMYASWGAVMVFWYYLRYISIDHRNDSQVGVHAILKNIPFIPEIVARVLFPFDLPVTPVFTPAYTFAGIIGIILIIVFMLTRKGEKNVPLILFGAIWFLGFCFPNMFVRLNSADDNFEYLLHRTYLPMVGFLIMFLSAAPEKWFNLQRRLNNIVIGSFLLLLSVFSIYQQGKYLDGPSYWGSAIRYMPEKSWFHYYMGRYYFKQKDNVRFEQCLNEAERHKSYAEFKYQLGMIYFADRKSYDTAYRYFSQAFKQGYGDPEGRANFIALCLESSADYFQKGEYGKAVKRCEEALNNDPGNADAAYNLGIYLVNNGEKQRAASMWMRAIRLKPDQTRAYRSLSLYYRYDAKKADSADWYAREYNKHGGKENLISFEK
jgi:tetratricopeptide (TPR) repeat protein